MKSARLGLCLALVFFCGTRQVSADVVATIPGFKATYPAGKIGGSHTSGCKSIVADGWSARFMCRPNGLGQVYLYHQNRKSGCGDEYDFPAPGNYSLGKPNRITERVVLNTPGQNNGVKKVSLTGVQLRGKVAANVARIDNVSLQTFYGGGTMPEIPAGVSGQSISVIDLKGRSIASLRWNPSEQGWDGWSAATAPSSPCVLIAVAKGLP